MDQCPKCLSGDIGGPTYQRGAYGGEHLLYRCSQCGYTQQRPTADSYDKKPHPWSQTVAPEKIEPK